MAITKVVHWRSPLPRVPSFAMVFLLSFGVALSACGAGHTQGEPGVIEIGEANQTSAFTRNFNPLLEVGDVRWPSRGSMYEPLLIFNPLTGDYVPWLAESYRFSDDRMRLEFKIRRGVTWSDGKPFTARDVAFTFELLKKFPALDIYGFWQYLKAVRADGDGKLVMEFSRRTCPGWTTSRSSPSSPSTSGRTSPTRCRSPTRTRSRPVRSRR